jgi:hypothetical protein
MITLSDEERDAIRRHTGALPVGITPYYASLTGSLLITRVRALDLTSTRQPKSPQSLPKPSNSSRQDR